MATRKTGDFSRLPDSLLDLVAGCFRALGDPTRLSLLRSLKEGEKTVQELVAGSAWTQPNISRHLSILARSGLVSRTKRGSFVHYGIADPRIFTLCEGVCAHLDRMLDRMLDRYAPPSKRRP